MSRTPIAEKLAEVRAACDRIMVEKTPRKGFTKAQRKAVWDAQKGECGGCEAELLSGFPIDHIIPLADGGAHDLGNWMGLCVPCHKRKTAKEATARASTNRIRKREKEGQKPSRLKSRNKWPKGRPLKSRGFAPAR